MVIPLEQGSSPKCIWIDGCLVPYEKASVHVLSHSLQYGFAMFEGIRCYKTTNGRLAIFRIDEHIRRLYDSARICGIAIPFEPADLVDACLQVIRASELGECYIRPLVFLGVGDMRLETSNKKVRAAIAAFPWKPYLGATGIEKGVRLMTSSFTHIHHNSMMLHAKVTGHYVTSMLAANEACNNGFDEALLLDTRGFVAETSGENVFLVQEGMVTTPLANSILPGITRDTVMEILHEAGVRVIEQCITRDCLYRAAEVFITGTAAEITPVRELDGRTIGRGVVGPITRKVQEVFYKIVSGQVPGRLRWLHYVPEH